MGMILICLIGMLALASGCGDDGGDGVEVVATTAVAADLARMVAGPGVAVETLVPESASPHDFAMSAKERARLERADVVVAWGAGLEAGLELDDADPVELAAGEDDPHVWMDPRHVAAVLPRLGEALADADPAHAAGHRQRARAGARELRRLDHDLAEILAAVPPARRKLVTSHDSLGHFARRYDFEFVGAPFGIAPESQPSAETVADLIERIERERVPAVFAEDTDDPELMEEIARAAGVEIVDDLLIEGFGGRVESYEAMLRHDARRIAEALAP
ncbi:MAG TPA: metal ABC transporter substrate-binding protein [Thermoleophilaceae bacterium]|nr:metal ABC transporter substrate-binding protein [Thermoleophilaceae bacterium]